jgi:KDO2-lipid IV(A) lauroyltransferase
MRMVRALLESRLLLSERASVSNTPLYRFWSPRYWTTWLSLGTLRVLGWLPFRAQMALGAALGWLLRVSLPRRRLIAMRNLEVCFPELSPAEREALLRRQFGSIGRGIFEIGMCWWGDPDALRARVRIEGLEHLQRELEKGKGVIILSAHFTTLEIGGRLLGLFTPFHLMYRPHKNPLFEEILRRRRVHHFERAIPRDDVRSMIRSLRDAKAVWYAPDQAWDRKAGGLVPFFGIPAHTNMATTRFAEMSGASVVPFFPIRNEDDSGYTLHLLPPMEGIPSDSAEADSAQINALYEEWIRKAPDQYLWVHRRFKRLEGEYADLYDEDR